MRRAENGTESMWITRWISAAANVAMAAIACGVCAPGVERQSAVAMPLFLQEVIKTSVTHRARLAPVFLSGASAARPRAKVRGTTMVAAPFTTARPTSLIECRFLSPARHPVEFIAQFIDIVLHLDAHLQEWVRLYDVWIYAILFFIIFAETGFVVTPFLPGDSLLFVAGALAALGTAEAEGGMRLGWLLTAVSVAAVTGNMVNYQIGRFLGPRVFQWEKSRLFNKEALLKTQAFYERHGGKTLVVSRFLPIFRTFAPFVAGIGAMNYGRFFLFNLSGGLGWCFSLTLAGYWFGNLPWVRQNLSLLIVGIILVSLLPMLIAYLMRDRPAET